MIQADLNQPQNINMEALLPVASYIILPTTIWFVRLGRLFGLNTDVIETNVLNQAAVVVIVIVFIGGAFRDMLNFRLKDVIGSENTAFGTIRQCWTTYTVFDDRRKPEKRQQGSILECRVEFFIVEKTFKFKRLYKKLNRILRVGRKGYAAVRRRTRQRTVIMVRYSILTYVGARIRTRIHAPLSGTHKWYLAGRRSDEQQQLSELYIRNTICRVDGWSSRELRLRNQSFIKARVNYGIIREYVQGQSRRNQ